MIWLVALLAFYFPQITDTQMIQDLTAEVLHSGDYGTAGETIELARQQCLETPGCWTK